MSPFPVPVSGLAIRPTNDALLSADVYLDVHLPAPRIRVPEETAIMPVIERCRTCRQRLKIPDARIGDGRPVRCPACGANVFAAPSPQEVVHEPEQTNAVITIQPAPQQPLPEICKEIPSRPSEFKGAPLIPESSDSSPDIPPSPPDSEPQKPSQSTGLLIVGAVILLSTCYLGGLLFSSNHQNSSNRTRQSAREDPYSPDCAIIRSWLKRNYGEVEVVFWGERTIHHNAALGGSVILSVRFRTAGDTRSKHGLFIIGPGDIVESATISD